MLREFQTRLSNGQIFVVIAFVATDVPSLIVENGIADREEIAKITCVGNADEFDSAQVLVDE